MTTFSLSKWLPYVIAVCLMLVVAGQVNRLLALKLRLDSAEAELLRLSRSQAMIGLRLATFEARDAYYPLARIIVAWDPNQSRGVITMQGLPAAIAGQHYQLWVLDPGAETPVNAGLIHPEAGTSSFAVPATSTPKPGFAITLEPGDGSPEPTTAILFAVLPGQ